MRAGGRPAAYTAVLLCCAAVAAAGSSTAARPARSTIFGGGFLGPVYEPVTHFDIQLLSLRVAADGRTFDLDGYWTARCLGISSPAPIEIKRRAVKIKPGGSFDDLKQHSSVLKGPWGLSGRFSSPTSATGTARLTFSFSDAGWTHQCTAAFPWEARAERSFTPPPGPTQPRAGASYYGTTSAGLPVVLRMRADGQSLAQAAVLWRAKCDKSRNELFDYTIVSPAPVQRDGSFDGNERYTEQGGLGDGFVGHATAIYTGRFSDSAAAGTWQIGIDVKDSKGRLVDHCLTGRLRFRVDL